MSQRFAKDTVFLVGLSGSCYGIIVGIVGVMPIGWSQLGLLRHYHRLVLVRKGEKGAQRLKQLWQDDLWWKSDNCGNYHTWRNGRYRIENHSV
jgi:hypothetical protein